MKADVFPAFGHKFIDEVTAADIQELMLEIETRGARDVAKRSHETTEQIFRYGVANGLAKRNPAVEFTAKDKAKAAKKHVMKAQPKAMRKAKAA